MGNLASTIPFTELWERLLTIARIDSPNNEDYARGVINDVYARTLPRLKDWEPLVTEGNLSMVAYYNTGTVTATAGSTSITGNATTWTSAMTVADGYRVKIAGNDNIYTFEYVSATSATISPALSGADNLSSKSYEVYKDTYELASDFGRFLKNGSIYDYSGGRVREIIKEVKRDVFREEFVASATDPVVRAMLSGVHTTNDTRLVRVNPAPKTARVYPYEYIKQVTPMSDYQTGTVSVTNASTAVVGTSTSWLTNAAVGDYFRVDGNGEGDSSKWYKIATVTDDTNIVLSTAYGEATEAGMSYTISKKPSAFPTEFHEFVLYEAVLTVIGEQTDPAFEGFSLRRNEILSDLKKNYESRDTNVQIRVEDDGYR